MLLGLEGFSNIASFNNPQDAILWLGENDADLIISDFIMPQMNGIDFLAQAKKIRPTIDQLVLKSHIL